MRALWLSSTYIMEMQHCDCLTLVCIILHFVLMCMLGKCSTRMLGYAKGPLPPKPSAPAGC